MRKSKFSEDRQDSKVCDCRAVLCGVDVQKRPLVRVLL